MQANPYIAFSGGVAREAMERYQSVFGGELTVQTFGDFKMEGMPPDGVMHSALIAGDILIMGSDSPQERPSQDGMVSIGLTGTDEAAMRAAFEQLADGGTVRMPLERHEWGDVFGMCQDRYGVLWLVNIGSPT